MADNLITAATYEQIATMLSKLATNYSNLASVFYDVFYNTTPTDVTFQMYDESGTLQTYTIPNRAKDLQNLLSGEGAPENLVDGGKGTLYQDLLNGDLYIKETPEGNDGWTQFATKDFLKNILIQGNGEPNEVGIVAPMGTLYIQVDAGSLWIKTTVTGSQGWERISTSSNTFASRSLDNLTEDGYKVFANPSLSNLSEDGVNRFANRSLNNLDTEGNARFEEKENINSKVTSLSASSTDTQYPSAKCVYDIIGNVEALINAL